MTEKPRLILHIGTHKTATSTIQDLLERERGALVRQGFYYALTNRPPFAHLPKHTSVYSALVTSEEAVRAERAQIMSEFETSGCHTLVISEEGLSSPEMINEDGLRHLPILTEGFDVTILVFLRRQDTFVESLWNQYTREKIAKQDIRSFVKGKIPLQHMHYLPMLEIWSRHGTVNAIGYESAQEKGIVATFAAATGMDLPPSDNRTNVSPSMGCAAFMLAMDQLELAYEWRQLESILGKRARRTALGKKLRHRLLNSFQDHNARLQALYGVTFPDKMPDEPERPLTLPDAAKIERLVGPLAIAKEQAAERKRRAELRKSLGRRLRKPLATVGAEVPGTPPLMRPVLPRLILHIGTQRTGSATLQKAMAQSSAYLASQGFLYARPDERHIRQNKHQFIFEHLAAQVVPNPDLVANLKAELSQTECHSLILSDEGLAHPFAMVNLDRMGELAEHFDLEVVCFLRRQDTFAEAFWAMRCREGLETQQIAEFMHWQHLKRYMSYLANMERWREHAAVSAIGFEHACAEGLVKSFAAAMGFDLPEPPVVPNEVPSTRVASALASLNAGRVRHAWQDVAEILGDDGRRTALGARLRRQLLAGFAEQHDKLARRFGVIFPTELPEGEEEEPLRAPEPEVMERLRQELAALEDRRATA